jgi:hypothetical protein
LLPLSAANTPGEMANKPRLNATAPNNALISPPA